MINTSIPIERVVLISKKDFYNDYVKRSRPIVFTGLAGQWEALKLWDVNYMVQQSKDTTQVNTVSFKRGVLEMTPKDGCTIERINLSEGIKATIENNRNNGGRAIITPIEDFPQEIQQQCPPFLYCAKGSYLRAKILIGPTGTVTPLHQDLFENLYTTVTGCKRITLFAPLAPVYRCSPFSKLPNFAQTDPEQPDYARFPKFKNAQAYTVDLLPGETLYIPAFWWHHLRNTQPSIAVSFWWSHGWRLIPTWMAATYKKAVNSFTH